MARLVHILPVALIILLLAVSGRGPTARAQTWVGPGTDWNAAGNWSPATVPNSATAVVNFTGDGPTGVNISASVQAQSLNFSNSDGSSYTLTSSNSSTLTISAINLAAGVSGIQVIDTASVATGSLLIPSGGPLTITNNSAAAMLATLVIGPNAVIGEAATNSSNALIFDGPGTTAFTGSVATTGGHSVLGGLQKYGPGTLDYVGDGTGLGGNLLLNGGTLYMDYIGAPATKMGGSGRLQLGGGVLSFLGNSNGPVTQGFSMGTELVLGHTDVQVYPNAVGSGVTFAAGTITNSNGTSTVDFPLPAVAPAFHVTTTTGNTAGLLGAGPAFATVGLGNTWATNSGGTIVGLGSYNANTFGLGINTDLTTSMGVANTATNSLRFNTGDPTLTLSGTNTLVSGGILVTPNATGGTITGGTLTTPGSNVPLFVHQYSQVAPFSINSALAVSSALAKTGPGTLVLGGNNTGLTGPIHVNRGNLTVTTPAAVNSANSIFFLDNRAGSALQTFTVELGNNVDGTISRLIFVSAYSPAGLYANVLSTGASTGSRVTLSGVLDSFNLGNLPVPTPIRFTGDLSNTSGFNLTAANTFTGNIDLFHGYLGITSGASLGNTANTLALDGGDVSNGGLEFLNGDIVVAQLVTLGPIGRVISNGTDFNTIASAISGPGQLVKAGTGTLAIPVNNTFTGGVRVTAGMLSLGGTGGLAPGMNLIVSGGGTFSASTSASPLHFTTLSLFNGTFQAVGTGQVIGVGSIANPFSLQPATLDFTGAGADVLMFEGANPAITINSSSTWLSPGNTTAITNPTFTDVVMTIPPGITLTNGIALKRVGGAGFRLTGGGTLFQNSDPTNAVNMTAVITVAQGTYRVVDAASNGGFGNVGPNLVLDGGTLSYGGPTATSAGGISVGLNGGTIEVESAATTLTLSNTILGPGAMTKTGPGTLELGSIATRSMAALTINAGTVQTGHDNTLGFGTVTTGPLGTLSFTGSTTTRRAIANSGAITVAAGQTLTLSGATVGGGFLRGVGTYAVTGGASLTGVTTFAATAVNVTGAASFANFTNGGTLAIAGNLAAQVTMNGFSNQGSGSVTVGAGSTVNAAEFQTYGVLTLSPNTTAAPTQLTNTGPAPLFFNGGSRTFISIPSNAGLFDSGIDLRGQNAVVAGGLFVNNGYVVDSAGLGKATIIADFGSLVKGAGFYQNSVQTVNGGKFQSGNSPGRSSFGSFAFGPGGVSNYIFAIDDATGVAGPSPDANGHVSGWSLVKAVDRPVEQVTTPGDLAWTADPAHPLTVALDTLVNPTTVGTDVTGPMAEFDPSKPYSWLAASWTGAYTGPTDTAALNDSTVFDTSGFLNPIAGAFGWSLDSGGHSLSLTYTPSAVPEPGTLALAIVAAAQIAVSRRQRRLRGVSEEAE
jgi:fibronectin-binding autotransporter adhesin